MAGYAFTVTCGAQKPRRAASLRGAKTTMGKMMNNETEHGVRGAIHEDGLLVLTAERSLLGWFAVLPPSAVAAAPWTSRRCPECGVWVYCADGPFAENDHTKTMADWLHWRDEHLAAEDRDATTIGFPYFTWNEEPVEAVKERRPLG